MARAVLAASTWSVLALTCHIELFVQAHYAESIGPRDELCPLFKDVFKFHWKDESRHVVLDELEWQDEHARLSPAERDQAVNDLIALVAAVDGILQAQAQADADYFVRSALAAFQRGRDNANRRLPCSSAYRWQYIISGVQHPHFRRLLTSMTTRRPDVADPGRAGADHGWLIDPPMRAAVNVLCTAVLIARVCQSIVHVSHEQTDAFVAVRSFFTVQLICFLVLIVIAVRAGIGLDAPQFATIHR